MIKIVCVGKVKEKYLREAIDDYEKRIGKYHKIDIIEVDDSNINEERDRILKNIGNRDYVITLEIDGHEIDSLELANKIDKLFITNSTITFVIGGSYGLHNDVKNRSDYNLSFSKFTFPHQLFRVILLEQIYRCFKILNNETYHK
ncbi:MAG: 23S rRNA (pseudouridine(1915)-N(3))-methyltransferase RlmH [Bacilli bacterium]|nr:23S rRNA (pseudouridine(1915)-N(3))-methyltransferase RlmH [Bacilli bacterium]